MFLELVLAGAASMSAEYPADQVLAAFSEACARPASPMDAEAAILAASWTKQEPEAGDRLNSILTFVRSQVGAGYSARTYEKTVEGRALDLVLLDISAPDGSRTRSCVIYDFAATAPIDRTQAEAWAGRAPELAETSSDKSMIVWVPGLHSGHKSDQIVFMAPGAGKFGPVDFSGLSLTAKYKESEAE